MQHTAHGHKNHIKYRQSENQKRYCKRYYGIRLEQSHNRHNSKHISNKHCPRITHKKLCGVKIIWDKTKACAGKSRSHNGDSRSLEQYYNYSYANSHYSRYSYRKTVQTIYQVYCV